ncbi:CPBP family intramembrane glutamic endopeptidase [Rhodanobacter aciditrophus]|uniref:CPBP family intramembrane glutamic endopeptidase n=1 Tax=Rhodanobacter aciditrophus TaxID=1623218 RepID=UPI003CF45CD9
MGPHAIAFTTPATAPRWKRWLVYSPLARIGIFILVLVGLALPTKTLMLHTGLGSTSTSNIDGLTLLVVFAQTIPALLAYLFLVRVIERRQPAELAWRKLVSRSLSGIALGAAIFGSVIGVLWLAGSYHVDSTTSPLKLLVLFVMVGPSAAIGEEIMFRGVLFRISEEGLGTWAALLISALAFGIVHLGNPNATLWSGLAIVIEAGLLLALAYHVTRSLWFCMGLHGAWNVMEGPVFGNSVSGLPPQGLLNSHLTGPDWLSGGSFGPENSLIAVACSLLVASTFLAIALKRRTIVPPLWARRGSNRDAP